MAIAIAYGAFHEMPKTFPKEEIACIFSPTSVQTHQSPFEKGLVYKGTLSGASFSVPCSIHYRGAEDARPLAHQKYLVQGTLRERDAHQFLFKAKTWEAIGPCASLAEIRYRTKQAFRKLLETHLSSPRVAPFLGSLTTGDVEDRMLRYEFGRVGLQHILAISGFHFGILIAFFSFCLQLFLSRAWRIGILFIAVNAYFLFVGSSPAVERSWLTALFFLVSQWINRPSSGLNLLGCAACIEIVSDPFASGNIGFQLSFLSCAGILLFYTFFEQQLKAVFPKRTWAQIQSLTIFSRHGYLFSNFFRGAASLTLAVNVLLLPLLLFHFHQFPLLGLLYNLFFPFLIGAALFLLLSALIFHALFPPIAELLYFCTDSLTSLLLNLSAYPPLALDFSLRIASISSTFVICYLGVLILAILSKNPDIYIHKKVQESAKRDLTTDP